MKVEIVHHYFEKSLVSVVLMTDPLHLDSKVRSNIIYWDTSVVET